MFFPSYEPPPKTFDEAAKRAARGRSVGDFRDPESGSKIHFFKTHARTSPDCDLCKADRCEQIVYSSPDWKHDLVVHGEPVYQ